MKLLRTLPTRRLVILLGAVLVLVAGAAAGAVTAFGGSGALPPPKPLVAAIHDALTAPAPEGVTARISFVNHLFPSGALLGSAGTPLMSGASGRLWATNDGRGRLELQSDAGDVQIVWDGSNVTLYDASSNTVYRGTLPSSGGGSGGADKAPPTIDEIAKFLTDAQKHANVSDAQPSDVAGRPAYTVTVSPSHDGGLLGNVQLSWDAERGVPLRAAIYAQGASSPVLEISATDISFGPVSTSDLAIAPPADAKTTDVTAPAGNGADKGSGVAPVTGVDAVRAAVPFTLVAPDALVGLPLKGARLVGGQNGKSALLVYGRGLGAVVVLEREAGGAKAGGGALGALPQVSIDGITGHELSTQLGTAITFDRNGVSYVLVGSLPSAAAEQAARDLK